MVLVLSHYSVRTLGQARKVDISHSLYSTHLHSWYSIHFDTHMWPVRSCGETLTLVIILAIIISKIGCCVKTSHAARLSSSSHCSYEATPAPRPSRTFYPTLPQSSVEIRCSISAYWLLLPWVRRKRSLPWWKRNPRAGPQASGSYIGCNERWYKELAGVQQSIEDELDHHMFGEATALRHRTTRRFEAISTFEPSLILCRCWEYR